MECSGKENQRAVPWRTLSYESLTASWLGPADAFRLSARHIGSIIPALGPHFPDQSVGSAAETPNPGSSRTPRAANTSHGSHNAASRARSSAWAEESGNGRLSARRASKVQFQTSMTLGELSASRRKDHSRLVQRAYRIVRRPRSRRGGDRLNGAFEPREWQPSASVPRAALSTSQELGYGNRAAVDETLTESTRPGNTGHPSFGCQIDALSCTRVPSMTLAYRVLQPAPPLRHVQSPLPIRRRLVEQKMPMPESLGPGGLTEREAFLDQGVCYTPFSRKVLRSCSIVRPPMRRRNSAGLECHASPPSRFARCSHD